MANIRVEVAGATAAVGYDLISGHRLARQNKHRVLMGVGLVGSTAAGDCSADIYVDNELVFTISNSATGLGIKRDDVLACRAAVAAGELLQAIVTDAAVTNPVALHLNLIP